MKVKEVETRLGIDRANIRYYEREGLLHPERAENRYRDYSESDVTRLKTVVILRKLGVPVAEIREVLEGNQSMTDVLAENEENLEKQMEELKGALAMCRRLEAERVELENFDADYYWEEINREEKKGNAFLDICRDYLDFEKELFYRDVWDAGKYARDFGWTGWRAVVYPWAMLLAMLFLLGLIFRLILGQSFWEGFLWPFRIFLFTSALYLPEFLLKKKHPRAAKMWANGLALLACVVVLAILLFLVLHTGE